MILIRKVWMDIIRRKGRSLLMILGISIGIGGLTAMNEATGLLRDAFFYSTDPEAVPNITCIVGSLPVSALQAISRLPNVRLVQARTFYLTVWRQNSSQQDALQITSINDQPNLPLGGFQLTSGHLPGPGEIVMDESDLELQPLTIGSKVTIDAPDGRHVSLQVAGFAQTRGIAIWHIPPAPLAYMSESGLRQIMQAVHGSVINDLPRGTQLLIKTYNPSTSHQTYQQITDILTASHLQPQPFSGVRNASFDADTQLSVIGVIMVVRLLTILTLLLVGMMIFAMITSFLGDQVQVIGTMKALGGTRLPLMSSYLLNLSLYSLSGTLFGIVSGLIAGYQLAAHLTATAQIQVANLLIPVDVGPFQISRWVIGSSALVGLLLPLLAGLWPLWEETGITVHQALTSYGVHVDARTPAASRGHMLSCMSQTMWLSLHSLFRKPKRLAFTLLSLGLSSAAFFSVQLTNVSLWAKIEQVRNIYHSDLRIDLSSSVGHSVPSEQAILALRALPNVLRVEPIDPIPISIEGRVLELNGLLAETQLYQPQITSGRWLHPHELGAIVINDSAAVRLHLQVGDQALVQTRQGPTHLTIVGIVHDLSEVSGSSNLEGRLGEVFTTLDAINQLRGLPAGSSERLWLQANDRSPHALRDLQQEIDHTLGQLGFQDGSALILGEDLSGISGADQFVMIIFNIAAILVAGIGLLILAHALATSVVERRLEIGILRSLGATSWRVGAVFGFEGLVLATLAWGVGIILGLLAAQGVLDVLGTFLGPIDLSFDPLIILLTFLFMMLIACLASIAPVINATHVRVRNILHYE